MLLPIHAAKRKANTATKGMSRRAWLRGLVRSRRCGLCIARAGFLKCVIRGEGEVAWWHGGVVEQCADSVKRWLVQRRVIFFVEADLFNRISGVAGFVQRGRALESP